MHLQSRQTRKRNKCKILAQPGSSSPPCHTPCRGPVSMETPALAYHSVAAGKWSLAAGALNGPCPFKSLGGIATVAYCIHFAPAGYCHLFPSPHGIFTTIMSEQGHFCFGSQTYKHLWKMVNFTYVNKSIVANGTIKYLQAQGAYRSALCTFFSAVI